jgi:diguanylate cyclase (GGDEF)-like protein
MEKITKLKHLVREQKKEIRRLLSLVDRDFLTGLYNRQGFIREAEKFFDEMKSRKIKKKRKICFENFSLIFIDIDDLKKVNDEYGHKVGDNAIKEASRVFEKSVRDLDITARWGGDEFLIGLVGAEEKEAIKIAEKIKRNLRTVKINGSHLCASFGIVSLENKKKKNFNLYEMIEKADMAMYTAKKRNGKNFIINYGRFKD